jgi:hypothetical protein
VIAPSSSDACMQAHGPLDEETLAHVAFQALKIVQGCHNLGILYCELPHAVEDSATGRGREEPPYFSRLSLSRSTLIASNSMLPFHVYTIRHDASHASASDRC